MDTTVTSPPPSRKRKGDEIEVALSQPSRLREKICYFGDVKYVFRVSPEHSRLSLEHPEAATATIHWQERVSVL